MNDLATTTSSTFVSEVEKLFSNPVATAGVIIVGCGVGWFLFEVMEHGYNVEVSSGTFKLYKAPDSSVPA